MEYIPLDNSSIKNDNQCDILKRSIDRMTPNEDESHLLLNKRVCEEKKLHPKESLQSLKVHTDAEWNFINKDFEHATSTVSLAHIRTPRTKPMPIIFHFASEDVMDIGQCDSDHMNTALNSMCSVDHFPTLSVHNFRSISTEKLSQSDIKNEQRTIDKCICSHKSLLINIDEFHKQSNASHRIDTTLTKRSSLSSSNTSLDRSLERLQATYRRYLAERKSNIQQQSITIDSQAYIRCRKHHQSIPVQIIASDVEEKLFQHTLSNSFSPLMLNNAQFSKQNLA